MGNHTSTVACGSTAVGVHPAQARFANPMTHTRPLEQTHDAAICTRCLSGICRQSMMVDGAPVGDDYSRGLQPVMDTRFYFGDTWKDGGFGRKVPTCRAV